MQAAQSNAVDPKPQGSAAKPAVLTLKELNARSAPLGSWEVAIFHPNLTRYEYTWEGKPRKGVNFSCYLVSVLNPAEYCLAEAKPDKMSNEEPLNKLKHKLDFQ